MTTPAHSQEERYIEVPIKYYEDLRIIFNERSLNKMIRSHLHVSAQSRDQVLDELIKWMIEYWQYEPNTDWLMDEFMIHLTELRTQGSRDT